MDANNNPIQHAIVLVFTAMVLLVFKYIEGIAWSTSLGRTSLVLLFLTLLIGPIVKLKKPRENLSPLVLPWTWRGELGIWFAITSLTHFIVIVSARPLSSLIKIGGSGFSLSNLVGLIALFWTILLAVASFKKVILFLGSSSWKWLHTSTYVVFYLVIAHSLYFQFFSTYGKVGPDWFGYVILVGAILLVLLQLLTFGVVITRDKKQKVQNKF